MIKSVHYQSKLSEKFVSQNLEKEPSWKKIVFSRFNPSLMINSTQSDHKLMMLCLTLHKIPMVLKKFFQKIQFLPI